MDATTPPVEGLPILTTQQLDADPHGVFRLLRAAYPIVAHETGSFIVLRYADIERIGRDPRVRATETDFPPLLGVTEGVLFDMFEQGMLTANNEVHRRRRAPFSRTFAARMIADLRPGIRQTAQELIDDWYADRTAELVEQFAAQLPARAISGLLGLPKGDIPAFTKLVYQVTKFFSLSAAPEEIPLCEAAARQLRDYVERTLDARRRSPRGDFLSTFLAAVDEAASLSPAEVVFQIVLLIIGGTDTTRVTAVAQAALLLQHREQWDAVCRNPGLVPGAVAEALRFEPSVASIGRTTTETLEVGDVSLPAGSVIGLSTISAMRDENAYERPDVFDIHRTDHPRLHPVFGPGVHRCIGEALARAELEEGLAVLTGRIPQMELDEAPVIKGHSGIRRVDTMRVSWMP